MNEINESMPSNKKSSTKIGWKAVLIACSVAILIGAIIAYFIAFSTRVYVLIFEHMLKKIRRGHLTIYSDEGVVLLDIRRCSEYRGEIVINRSQAYGTFCKQAVLNADIGIGEAYGRGEWSSPDMISLMTLLLANDRELQSKKIVSINLTDKENITHHYDIGNDFYQTFLDEDLMAYTCAFFLTPDDTLSEAQHNKIDAVIRKMECHGHERILDVGCGWGSLARYVAQQTKSSVDGVTLSDEQSRFISDTIPDMRVYNMSYEDLPETLNGTYDRIYSIGMFEHVRYPNFDKFFAKMRALLKDGGRFVLHTITYGPSIYIPDPDSTNPNLNFITKHIFPGGQIPKKAWVEDAAARNGFMAVHTESYGGQNYGKTLKIWCANMLRNRDLIRSLGYEEELVRMYEFYFLTCAAAFLTDRLNVTHFVFDKETSLEHVSTAFHKC